MKWIIFVSAMLILSLAIISCSENTDGNNFTYHCKTDKDCEEGYICDKTKGCIIVGQGGGEDVSTDVLIDIGYDVKDIQVDVGLEIGDILDVSDISKVEDILDVFEDTTDVIIEDKGIDIAYDVVVEDIGVEDILDTGCSSGCNQNAYCLNGNCVCDSGYYNCDNSWSNGCEENKKCLIPYGWDYGLNRKCVTTTGIQGEENYFAMLDDCKSGNTDNGRWLVVVESENAPAASCPGPVNRSFLINGLNSPVTMSFYTNSDNTYTVNMKVDHSTYPHPCGKGYFTFFSFMDHLGYNGGPFPLPRDLVSSHILSYNHWAPTIDDAVRGFVGAQFWWDGKARLIEVFINSINWGDAIPNDPCAIYANEWSSELTYVVLNGSCFGLEVVPLTNTSLTVNWRELIDYSVSKGYLSNALDWNNTAVQAVFVGVEVKNNGVADLWHKQFRVMGEK